MGALRVFDPAVGDWTTLPTTGPVGAPGPQGEVGPQGIQGVPGGAVVRYRSPYINTWTSDTSTTALKTIFTDEVQIDDPTGDFMLVASWRCIADLGAAGIVQMEARAGSYLAPTHTVIATSADQGLWGGVSRVWFPAGSAIAAAPGPVTVTLKAICSVASKTFYDPSLVLVQLNSETETTGGGGAGTWADAVLESGLTGAFKYKVSGGVCSVSYDVTRAANLLPADVITTLPPEARPPAQAFLFSDIGGNLGVRSWVLAEPDGTVHSIEEMTVSNGLRGSGTYGTA